MNIQKAREILEKNGKKYSDEEIQEMISSTNVLVDMALDMWFKMTPEERKKIPR